MDPSRGYELVNEMRLLHRTLAAHGQDDLVARLTTIGTHTKAWADHLWQAQAPFTLKALAEEVHGIEQELQARDLRSARLQAHDIHGKLSTWARDVAAEHADLRASLVRLREELAHVTRDNAGEIDAPTGEALQVLIARADALATGGVEDFGAALLEMTHDLDRLAGELTGRSVELPWRLQAIGGGYGATLEDAGMAISADDAFSFR